MNNYNLVIVENKQCIPFLNLTQQEFYNKLWEWSYEYDLWDWIEENNPNKEEFESIIHQYINDDLFHKFEDDEISCFAFVNTDEGIVEYQINEELFNFIKFKIKKHYD